VTRLSPAGYAYWTGKALTDPTDLQWWDGESVVDIDVLYMPNGYVSVSNMLDRDYAYFAHRGGSADYPEHSLRAYTQAVIEGFGCLEVSVQRTSDGVFVANHDPTIDSVVFGGGTFPPISSMTWEELSEKRIKPPSGHPERKPEPFIRLEDLVNAYGASHILMVDPKNIGSGNYPALLDFMDEHGGPTRWIGKWVGSNPSWSSGLRARGYKGWGAFYNSDDPNMVAEAQDQWDILGFNYGAPQEDWDFILSFGKPVYAHVCPDQASVDGAIAKGASGAQVSGIEHVDVYKAF
jgi:hypothetical protein